MKCRWKNYCLYIDVLLLQHSDISNAAGYNLSLIKSPASSRLGIVTSAHGGWEHLFWFYLNLGILYYQHALWHTLYMRISFYTELRKYYILKYYFS